MIYFTEPPLINFIGFALMYIFGVFISNIAIGKIINGLYQTMKEKKDRYSKQQASILGIVERTLFLTIFLIDVQIFVFVGIWFTLKMIIKWNKWSKKKGRKLFNNFLIGNGLSLVFSIFSFFIYKASFFIEQSTRLLSMVTSLLLPYLICLIIYLFYLKPMSSKT